MASCEAGLPALLLTLQYATGKTAMPGYYFEELKVGRLFRHEIRRTVTEADNILFSAMTHNPQPLHIDRHFSAETEWGQPLMNSLFTLGLVVGISVNDTTIGTIVANLGMSDVKFPHPLFQGDTVSVTTKVSSKRASKSRPDAGIVEFEHKAFNQTDDLVAICRRQVMVRRKPSKPKKPAKAARAPKRAKKKVS
jgi:acyl dehydratase